MKYFCFCIVLLLIFLRSSGASTPHWTKVSVSVDSLNPSSLVFFDSLHGYLGGFIPHDSHVLATPDRRQMLWFETTNGGRSWTALTDTLLLSDSGSYIPFLFPSMLFPSLIDRFIFTGNYKGNYDDIRRILHSKNAGKNWQIEQEWSYPNSHATDALYFLSALSAYNLFAYNADDGRIYQSSNGGRTFPVRYSDTTYRNSIMPFYPLDSSVALSSISLCHNDPVHWTVTLNRNSNKKIPLGLQTLVTSNAGIKWQTYNTPIPQERSAYRINGTLQAIRNTATVFYFTGYYREGLRDVNVYENWLLSTPMYGINYLSSSDYGVHWDFHREFGNSRRGYEAVGEKELWMTVANTDSLTEYDYAHKIIHTLDNGATWEVDSTTLTQETEKYDGRIVTFSDPRHGWIAAIDHTKHTYIYRYDASEQGSESVAEASLEYNDYCKLYPNPATEELSLQTLWFQQIKKLVCYDMLGRQHDLSYTTNNNTAKLSVKNLLPGCYIIEVIHTQGTYMRRFIVQ